VNRRRLTLKRIDPWSVLKFGIVANLALLVIGLIGFGILWLVITQLDLIDKVCSSVGDLVLGLEDCGINGGALFGRLLLLGLLGVVVQTGIMVFMAFLYNLIADLTGGLTFGFLDEAGDLQAGGALSVRTSDTSLRTAADRPGVGAATGDRPSTSSTTGATHVGSSPTTAAGWSSRPDSTMGSASGPGSADPKPSEAPPVRPAGPASTGAGSWRPSDRTGEDDLFGSRDREDDTDR
jgi:hypothetical protein